MVIKLCEYCRTYYDIHEHKQYAYNEIPTTISNYEKIVKGIDAAVARYQKDIPVKFTPKQITQIKNGDKVFDEAILDHEVPEDKPVDKPVAKKSKEFSIDNFLGNVTNNIQKANEVAQKETSSKSEQAKKRKANVSKTFRPDDAKELFKFENDNDDQSVPTMVQSVPTTDKTIDLSLYSNVSTYEIELEKMKLARLDLELHQQKCKIDMLQKIEYERMNVKKQ